MGQPGQGAAQLQGVGAGTSSLGEAVFQGGGSGAATTGLGDIDDVGVVALAAGEGVDA